MANQATYRVHIPTTDPIGQPLHEGLADTAHRWLRGAQPRLFKEGWVEGPHQSINGPQKHLVIIGEDSPESDSYTKQLAAHVGEMANHWGISVVKSGQNGTESWIVPNRHYEEGSGAGPESLQRRGPVGPPQSNEPVPV